MVNDKRHYVIFTPFSTLQKLQKSQSSDDVSSSWLNLFELQLLHAITISNGPLLIAVGQLALSKAVGLLAVSCQLHDCAHYPDMMTADLYVYIEFCCLIVRTYVPEIDQCSGCSLCLLLPILLLVLLWCHEVWVTIASPGEDVTVKAQQLRFPLLLLSAPAGVTAMSVI